MRRTKATASTLVAFACCSALLICAPRSAGEPQSPSVPPVNVERVRERLKAPPPAGKLSLHGALPVATFRTSVEQRVYLLTFEELLRMEFKLTPLQQQSQDWYGRCCGINLIALVNSLDKEMKRRQERKVREQVARELALVEAAAKK